MPRKAMLLFYFSDANKLLVSGTHLEEELQSRDARREVRERRFYSWI